MIKVIEANRWDEYPGPYEDPCRYRHYSVEHNGKIVNDFHHKSKSQEQAIEYLVSVLGIKDRIETPNGDLFSYEGKVYFFSGDNKDAKKIQLKNDNYDLVWELSELTIGEIKTLTVDPLQLELDHAQAEYDFKVKAIKDMIFEVFL